jgi:hypothetical protein
MRLRDSAASQGRFGFRESCLSFWYRSKSRLVRSSNAFCTSLMACGKKYGLGLKPTVIINSSGCSCLGALTICLALMPWSTRNLMSVSAASRDHASCLAMACLSPSIRSCSSLPCEGVDDGRIPKKYVLISIPSKNGEFASLSGSLSTIFQPLVYSVSARDAAALSASISGRYRSLTLIAKFLSGSAVDFFVLGSTNVITTLGTSDFSMSSRVRRSASSSASVWRFCAFKPSVSLASCAVRSFAAEIFTLASDSTFAMRSLATFSALETDSFPACSTLSDSAFAPALTSAIRNSETSLSRLEIATLLFRPARCVRNMPSAATTVAPVKNIYHLFQRWRDSLRRSMSASMEWIRSTWSVFDLAVAGAFAAIGVLIAIVEYKTKRAKM